MAHGSASAGWPRTTFDCCRWEPAHYHRSATLTLDAATALRAGDALHLACAEQAGAKSIATLDDVLGRNTQRLKIKRLAFT